MTTRGERNNNPGNIDYHPSIPWRGLLGLEIVPEGESYTPRFCRFDTAVHGIRAIGKTIRTYQTEHGLDTVRGIINRWAPPSENSTGAYVNLVAHALSCDPDIAINTSDPTVLKPIVNAIIQQENGENIYSDAVVDDAVASALTL